MEPLPFLKDIYPKNLLYATTIRSPIVKGKLQSIQTPQLPDNFLFLSAEHIPGENRLEGTNIPIFADKNLSYIGEPVGILLGPNKTILEELASKCTVIAEEEKPVFDCGDPGAVTEASREIKIGDTNESFEKAEKIITEKYSTGIQEHWYAEPTGAVSWLDEDKLVVRTATQWSSHVKRSVTLALGINPDCVFVEPACLNLHMDGKLFFPSLIACHAALGTYITKLPVRLILNKDEDFLFSPKRFSSQIGISSSVDKNGVITGTKIDVFVNLGAYSVNEKEILDQICLGSLGVYNFKNLLINTYVKNTNIPPQGPFSGFGLAQGLFAIERHVSQIAQNAGQDPANWRKSNIKQKALFFPSAKNNVNAAKRPASSLKRIRLIDLAAKMSDFFRKWDSYELLRQSKKDKSSKKIENPRGIGIAIGFQGNGLLYPLENSNYSLEVTFTKESVLEIKTNLVSYEDYNKIWDKLAAEILSIEPEMVRVVQDNTLDCGPSCASRNITAVTKAVEKCCLAIRKQRFHEPLPITVRRTIKQQPGSLLDGNFNVLDTSGFQRPGMAAAVVDVTIDLIDCVPIIRGVWIAVDGGKIISKNRVKRSLSRGTIQALGWSFTENLEYINGVLPRSQYDNFSIFSPAEIPKIQFDFISDESAETKGIGELPFTCVPAAFMQAVSQAMNHNFTSIPLKSKDIYEILRGENDN